MSERSEKCQVCGALLDEEDLFCSNCGTEVPKSQRPQEVLARTWSFNFNCQGCGASMSYDASAQNIVCPFCGNEGLVAQQDAKMLGPARVIPFGIQRGAAESVLAQWLAKGFWRPGDLASAAQLHKVLPVYVPYWIFRAQTHTFWTADTSETPPGARASWYPISGEHHGTYSGLLIGASQALTAAETDALCPFHLDHAVPPDEVDLDHAIVEQFRVARKYARPLAFQGLEALERQACAKYVPGRHRHVRVNVKVENLASEPVLLPVWIMVYKYRNRSFRFLINGQTGQCHGQAPVSYLKFAAAGLLVALAVGGCLLATVCSGVLGR